MKNSQELYQKTSVQPRRALTLDVEKYERMLDAPELTANERSELIQALWSFILAFMDLGYEVLPAIDCGQNEDDEGTPLEPRCPVLSSDTTPTQSAFARASSPIRKEAS